jgi:hypothetical protein
MKLSELEKKILILAMDHNAANGEFTNAAVKFVNLLRKRYKSGHEFIADLETLPERQTDSVNRFGDFIMPIGKYKGTPLKNIPIKTLTWYLANINLWPATKMAIEGWLTGREPEPFDPFN